MLRALLAFSMALVLVAGANAAPVIDNFTTPDPSVSFNKGFSTIDVISPGVTRTVSAPLKNGDSAFLGNQILLTFGTTDELVNGFALFSGTSAITSTLNYTFASPANLQGGGIELGFRFLDDGQPNSMTNFSAVITAVTSTGTVSSTINLNSSSTPTSFIAPLSTFTPGGNFSQVSSLTIDLNDSGTPQQGVDFVLTSISVAPIPEPTTLATLGLLSVCGGYAVRRRMKAAPVAQV